MPKMRSSRGERLPPSDVRDAELLGQRRTFIGPPAGPAGVTGAALKGRGGDPLNVPNAAQAGGGAGLGPLGPGEGNWFSRQRRAALVKQRRRRACKTTARRCAVRPPSSSHRRVRRGAPSLWSAGRSLARSCFLFACSFSPVAARAMRRLFSFTPGLFFFVHSSYAEIKLCRGSRGRPAGPHFLLRLALSAGLLCVCGGGTASHAAAAEVREFTA